MKMKFLSPLREGRGYEGVIREYELKDGIMRIFVELDDEPNNLYLCSMRASMRKGSPFYNFCNRMGVIDNDFELDYLNDLPVWVEFKKGNDGNMYIREMYVKEEDDEEDDDEE